MAKLLALVVGCIAIGLAHTSSEGVSVHELSDVGAASVDSQVMSAIGKAADKVQAVALAEANKFNTVETQTAAASPSEHGIPKEVIESLSNKNLVLAIRAALEKMTVPPPSNDKTKLEARERGILAQRITRATEAALQDPVVMQAMKASSEDAIARKTKEVAGKSQMETKVQAKVEKSVHAAEVKAIGKAEKVLQRAAEQRKTLTHFAPSFKSARSMRVAQARIARATREESEAREFLAMDHTADEKAKVHLQTKKAMTKEEGKLAAQEKDSVDQSVAASLASQVALEAKREFEVKMENAYRHARAKVEKAQAEDQKNFDAKTAEINGAEAGAFTDKVEVFQVQGYWNNRRRFSAQKHFVQHGYFLDGKSPEDRLAARKKARAMVLKHNKQEEQRMFDLKREKIEEEMNVWLPPHSVQAKIRKIALKLAGAAAEKVTASAAMKAETGVVDQQVREELETEKPQEKKAEP